jgi:DNA-binding response OmpR family regulator
MARIILLEPDVVLSRTYGAVLASDGHEVQICRSAQEAIFSIDENCPDLILVELQLVGHSGIEFLYELRSYTDWCSVPVIVHTQVPPHEFNGCDELFRTRLGMAEYLYKPHTSMRGLRSTVRRYVPAVV